MKILLAIARLFTPVALSAALLLTIAHIVGFEAALARVRTLPTPSLFGAAAAFLLSVLVGTYRYAGIIEDLTRQRPAMRSVLSINFLSLFLTYLLPIAALADVARVGAACRWLGLGAATSARSVVHDRLLALAGFVLSAACSMPLMILIGAPWTTILATAAVIAGSTSLWGVLMWLARPPGPAAPRLWRVLHQQAFHFRSHVRDLRRVARQGMCAAATTLAIAAQICILAAGLGLRLPWSAVLAYTPLIALAQVVPFLYGGFGAREAVIVALLAGRWTGPDGALALGIGLGLSNMLASVPGVIAATRAIYDMQKDFALRRRSPPPGLHRPTRRAEHQGLGMSTNLTHRTIKDFGEQWVAYQENPGYYGSTRLLADIFGPLLSPTMLDGARVAEIGSGTGRIVNMLLDAGAACVIAVEPSDAIAVLKKNTVARRDRITYVHDTGETLAAGLDLDLVVSIGVLHHIPDPAPVVAAAFRALRPGGRFFGWVYGREGNEGYLRIAGPLRKVTTHLPHGVLLSLGWMLGLLLNPYIAACAYGKLPMHRYMRGVLAKMSPSVRRLTIYDQLNPAYAKYYRRDEAARLWTTAGFTDVQMFHRHGYSWSVVGSRPVAHGSGLTKTFRGGGEPRSARGKIA